ncbi:hypothetical protein BV20DRAFT_458991 [Pilatotrama ljubarskyi]|nr:hypothetical protein BV20DRAFT_458991 [Pilatotrama ljubarskyi]
MRASSVVIASERLARSQEAGQFSHPLSCLTNREASTRTSISPHSFCQASNSSTYANDVELDEEELDREIRGYSSDADLDDVEVGSDDFEVTGVVYASDEDEDSLEVEEETSEATGDQDGEEVEEEEESEDAEASECGEESEDGFWDAGCDREDEYARIEDVAVWGSDDEREDQWSGLMESRSPGSPKGSSSIMDSAPAPPHRTLRPKRKRDNAFAYAHEGDVEEEDVREDAVGLSSPLSDAAVESHCDAPALKRSRMAVQQARKYDTKVTGTRCGVDRCQARVSRGIALKHFKEAHYPECLAVATGIKGKTRGKGKGKEKENVPEPTVLPCKYGNCTATAKTLANLVRHMATVHWGWGAVCPLCGKSLSRLDSMLRHFERRHPVAKELQASAQRRKNKVADGTRRVPSPRAYEDSSL